MSAIKQPSGRPKRRAAATSPSRLGPSWLRFEAGQRVGGRLRRQHVRTVFTEGSTDARGQLGVLERLDDVVDGTGVEALDASRGVGVER